MLPGKRFFRRSAGASLMPEIFSARRVDHSTRARNSLGIHVSRSCRATSDRDIACRKNCPRADKPGFSRRNFRHPDVSSRKMRERGKRMTPTRGGRDALSASLRYQLTCTHPRVAPCGLPAAVSRAAALAAWVCSLHQTFDWPDSRCAIALVLPRRPSREVGRLGEPSLPMIGSPAFPTRQDV